MIIFTFQFETLDGLVKLHANCRLSNNNFYKHNIFATQVIETVSSEVSWRGFPGHPLTRSFNLCKIRDKSLTLFSLFTEGPSSSFLLIFLRSFRYLSSCSIPSYPTSLTRSRRSFLLHGFATSQDYHPSFIYMNNRFDLSNFLMNCSVCYFTYDLFTMNCSN